MGTQTALELGELQVLRDRIVTASLPEALFGELEGQAAEQLAKLNLSYFELVNKCHAKHYLKDAKLLDLANEAFEGLSELYQAAQESIKDSSYGKSPQAAQAAANTTAIGIIESEQQTYFLRELLAEGDLTLVYRADYEDDKGNYQDVCIKIVKDTEENQLLEKEQDILAELDHVSIPVLLDAFELPDGRAANVLSLIQGYNLHELREMDLYADGLTQATDYHIGWIIERQLALLGYLHEQGIVHGSVEPAHLLVQPDTHNVFLIDFCWAIKDPDESKHIEIGQEYYSAPEVFDKAVPHPAMDIYGLGKSIIYLLGEDPEFTDLPESLDPMLVKFIDRMTEEDPDLRANDAHQLAYHLVVIRDEVSGEDRKFIPLPVAKTTKGNESKTTKTTMKGDKHDSP